MFPEDPPGLAPLGRNRTLHQLAQLLQVAVQAFKDAHGCAFAFFDDPEEKVLHTDVVVSQPKCFFTAEGNDLSYPR